MDTEQKTLLLPPSKLGKWFIRAVSIMWGIAILPASLMAIMSVMLFDAPGSENSFFTKLFAFSLMTAPLVLLVSCVGGLIVSFKKDLRREKLPAKVFMLLPLINIIFAIVAWILIDVVCDGQLSCY